MFVQEWLLRVLNENRKLFICIINVIKFVQIQFNVIFYDFFYTMLYLYINILYNFI